MVSEVKLKNWHLSFEIPEKDSFSGSVQKAIETGVVVARARREIVQVVRTLVLQHTKFPTSEQYNRVCEILVTKYPNLKDDRTGGYVSHKVLNCYLIDFVIAMVIIYDVSINYHLQGSWKESLRTAFKNFRRDRPEEAACSSTPKRNKEGEPPSKRLNIGPQTTEEISEEEYEQALSDIQVLIYTTVSVYC